MHDTLVIFVSGRIQSRFMCSFSCESHRSAAEVFFFFFEDCAISVSVNSCVLHENLIKALQVKTFVSAVFDPPFPLASSYLTANTQAVLKRS